VRVGGGNGDADEPERALLLEHRQGEQGVWCGEEARGEGMGPLTRVLPDEQPAVDLLGRDRAAVCEDPQKKATALIGSMLAPSAFAAAAACRRADRRGRACVLIPIRGQAPGVGRRVSAGTSGPRDGTRNTDPGGAARTFYGPDARTREIGWAAVTTAGPDRTET
jgi:hypothetical protein